MANKEIFKVKIINCDKQNWWYFKLIGEEYYVAANINLLGEITFTPIPHVKDGRFILFNDVEILEKVTRVILPVN